MASSFDDAFHHYFIKRMVYFLGSVDLTLEGRLIEECIICE